MSKVSISLYGLVLAATLLIPASASAIQVLEPNGGEVWIAGDLQKIRWSPSGAGTVRIEYGYLARFPVYLVVDGAPDTGTFEWTVVNLPSPTAVIRVTRLDTGESDRSDALFTVTHIPAAQSAGAIYPSAIENGRVEELNVLPSQVFNFYLVIDNDAAGVTNPPASGFAAWEATVSVPPQVTVLERAMTIASSLDFGSGEDNWIVGTGGVCVGDAPFAVVRYLAMLLAPYSDLIVAIGPAVPSSFNDGSPGWTNSGCGSEEGGLWPFRERHELVINPAGVPAAAVSWGEIKASY